jgi:hypothetical protein
MTPYDTVEALLFSFAVVVLSIATTMFVRLYHSLSPPTKTMLWVLGFNLLLASLYLLFSGVKLFYMTRGRLVPPGEAMCRYLHPLARSCQLLTWCGQPIMAWVTLKTIRSQAVSPRRLAALSWGSLALGVTFLVLSEVYMPGNIMWGSYCVVPPVFAKRGSAYLEHFEVPFPLMDPRIIHALVGLSTLVTSVVFYVRAYRHLSAFKKRCVRERW